MAFNVLAIARPVEWLLYHPAMAANDARRNAEYDRIDAISAQRRVDWDRCHSEVKRRFEGLAESARDWEDYHERQSAEHSRWVRQRSEEHRWRTEAHETWFEDSRRLRRKSDRNLLWFIWGIAFATALKWAAIVVWV